MEKIKTIVVVILLSAFFIGCDEKGRAIDQVQNGDFNLEFLFEKNGCKMYRFLDGGRYVYWSDCQGKVQSDYTTRSGKVTVVHHEESVTSE